MSSAVAALVIFGICIALYVFSKLPSALTALMGLILMVLFGVVSFRDGFKNFSSSTVMLICATMVIGQAAFETGLALAIGRRIIDLANNNERCMVAIGTLITGVISAFLSNVATFAVMISVLTSVCSAKETVRLRNVILPAGMAAVIGGAATLVGSTPQLTAQGIIESFLGKDNAFHFFTFIIPGSIIMAFLVLYTTFIGYPLGKRIWGNRDDDRAALVKDDSYNKGVQCEDKTRIFTMSAIVALTISAFILNDLIVKVIPEYNIGITSMLAACACVLTGCITHKAAISSINWSLAIWFCASLGMAEGLNTSGGGQLLAEWFLALFGDKISAFGLFAASVFFVVLLTQFLSNSTVLAIILPIMLPVIMEMGYQPFPYAVGMTMGAAMAVATPLANSTIAMSMIANYKFTDFLKYGGPMTLIAYSLIVLIVPMLWPLV